MSSFDSAKENKDKSKITEEIISLSIALGDIAGMVIGSALALPMAMNACKPVETIDTVKDAFDEAMHSAILQTTLIMVKDMTEEKKKNGR